MIAKLKKFTGEVRGELAKAQWPWNPHEKGVCKFKELSDSTKVVLVAMFIVGGYIAFFDFILVNIVEFLVR